MTRLAYAPAAFTVMPVARVLSGIQPTGDLHLGNYLGAVRQWVADQHEHDSYFCVVDLHALTVPRDPGELRARTLETTLVLVAAGIDPDLCTLFVQSHVAEHTGLSWLLECVASMGELRRMTQFKEKAKAGEESARVGLFTYPVLQAADILLYDADRVPVGDEQKQHLELARDLAQRFNQRYGQTFVEPEAAVPTVAARVMDLQSPDDKMSKSAASPKGTVLLLDEPDAIARKFRRAVTDPGASVRFDPVHKPGVSNLLQILAAATDQKPEDLVDNYSQYGPLKEDAAQAVIELLRPLRERYTELAADPDAVEAMLALGADKARGVASLTLSRARDSVGLLPPG
ncbi:MAG TPA: tryptophan--tRNA ligase [Acidimicrobiales bacterium]|nr:tryptophan--tRNA ligase [Acidimicrobiales bacterium]